MNINNNSSINNCYDLIVKSIEGLNTLSVICFNFPIFQPKPSLLYELSKPITSMYDLNIKLLQFGLLIDSIQKQEIDKYLKSTIKKPQELRSEYLKISSRRITKSSEVKLFRELYGIMDKEIYLIEKRNTSTIDSLELLLHIEINDFDKKIIENLRILRSFRNISEFAHDKSPKQIEIIFKKLGFSYPLQDSSLEEFWRIFLNHFLEILLRIKSSLQAKLSKIENDKIIVFNSYFEKAEFNINDENRIIFEIENKRNTSIEIYAYKFEFLYNKKILVTFNWHIFGESIKPKDHFQKKWGNVKPFEYYGIKFKGNWEMKSSIQYKYENEISMRITDSIFKFDVLDQ
ncbi:MAG: hypothetical protein KAW92_05170 [Candidatus Cloacimonetes bacterium]|nr:hypothetical protein [Candidatus Cloacimonadota bacterium]